MLRSMTAYGRASTQLPLGRFVVEVQSVNRKFLEVNALLPKELARFESEVKQWIGGVVARGQVSCKVSAFFESSTPMVVSPNIPLAREIKAAWDKIAKAVGVAQKFELSFLADVEGMFIYGEEMPDEELYRQALKGVVEKALESFLAMKAREGQHLLDDIAQRMYKLVQMIGQIALYAPDATKRYQQKLKERIEALVPGSVDNDERLLREIGIYAEKVDIAEEITRFSSHLSQLDGLLNSAEVSVGKTLEFVLQELNREINTIGSKSGDMRISCQVVEIKGELEKIREQIQNVE